ncbi:YeeE/YedE thiosulfate transporter family protein [Draconibacterium orientale]|uniref:YeeE/YedE thiosulfate transporter family protein n=1 Tax=Draconibacterium orientale TaxID=1168034 RepID=UPI0029C0A950|nr:YeeE/YedE thiosulfate transporter family protein [Draconibacterium orientale]
MRSKKYMNPYLAGFLLGLILLATIYITGRGLGASGAMKSVVIESVNTVAPQHAGNTQFYKEYAAEHPNGPLRSWLVFEVLGVIIGAFLSGVISDRVGWKLEKGPKATNAMRIVGAITGGALFGLGSQLGRGCTSGSALSGMAVMSFGGIITMMSIFGMAYMLAFFFRRLWLK